MNLSTAVMGSSTSCAAVPPRPLTFRLAGSATCNRFFGSYTSAGPQLKVAPVGATMMACPEALMRQERKLLDLLPAIQSYRIDKTGALVLTTQGGKQIVARR